MTINLTLIGINECIDIAIKDINNNKLNYKTMKRRILITNRLPKIGEYVTTIDITGQEIVYRLNDDSSWNMHPDESVNYIHRYGESAYENRKTINNNYPLLFWVDEINESNYSDKQFLLRYKLGRRSDEGWGRLALVSAKSEKTAIEILIDKVSYKYTDALACEMLTPSNIQCLNI